MGINVTLPFDTPANYAPDGVEISGGLASLVNLRPADIYYFAGFEADEDADIFQVSGDNTLVGGAAIAAGALDLRGGVAGMRLALNANEAAAALQEQACIRFRVIPNYSGVPAADRFFFGVGDAVGNVNAMSLYHRAGGGQPAKLVFSIYDGAGVSLYGAASANQWLPVAGQEYEIEVNYDITAGVLRIFIDGVLFANVVTGTGTRSAVVPQRFVLGTSQSLTQAPNFQITSFAMFNAVQHTANYTPNTIGPDCIPPDYFEGTVETVASWQAEALNSFSAVVDETDGTVTFAVELDGVLKYWDGLAWADSDGSFAQTNTAADINTNVPTLVTPPAQSIRMFALLVSNDGSGEPTLDTISFDYDFGSLEPAASPLCEIYGFIRDMGGNPVVGATVTAREKVEGNYVESSDPAVVLGEVSAVTDVDGRFDLKLIQGLSVRLTIEDADGRRVRYKHGTYERLDFTVPAQDFAALTSLV